MSRGLGDVYKRQLQDVIVAGVNAVITQIEEVSAAEMEKVTGGVNIPGLV